MTEIVRKRVEREEKEKRGRKKERKGKKEILRDLEQEHGSFNEQVKTSVVAAVLPPLPMIGLKRVWHPHNPHIHTQTPPTCYSVLHLFLFHPSLSSSLILYFSISKVQSIFS